jgi:two-component system sensor histidine kinase YesM
MYTYLYYEASLLDSLHVRMTRQLYLEIVLIVLFLLVLVAAVLYQTLKLTRSMTRPIQALCSRVSAISDGDLEPHTPIQAREYEIQTLSDGFENMVVRINQLIEQNRQEQISLRSAELALLQAQINPHFLYNTLDAIVWLIEMEKNEQAEEMVTSLSAFFRSSLSNGRDIITLREEEQQVRSYLEIQQVRYKDILQYQIDIDPQLAEYEIPKLTLQPLVENALYHGIKLKRGQGHITVGGTASGENIILTVTDDGAGMTRERLEQVRSAILHEQQIGFGVATVHERLQLMFGPAYGLQIDSSEGEGTCVTVTIPKKLYACRQADGGEDEEAIQETDDIRYQI